MASGDLLVDASPRDLVAGLADVLALTEPALLRLWRATGVTFSQRRLLRQLRDRPRGASELAASAGLSAPSLSRMVDRLERSGFVARTVDTTDRRRVVIVLTQAGQQVLAEHPVLREAGLVAAARALDPGIRAALLTNIRDLVRLARAAQRS